MRKLKNLCSIFSVVIGAFILFNVSMTVRAEKTSATAVYKNAQVQSPARHGSGDRAGA